MKEQWDEEREPFAASEIGDRIWNRINRKHRENSHRNAFARILPIAAAACVAVLMISGSLFYYLTRDHGLTSKPEYLEITASNYMYYQLPDSSKVWLQPKSSIRFAKEFNKDREVWLSGNSLFEVNKCPGSTFRVHIENAFIEVKGTRFLVEKDNDGNDEITLFNGCIEFNIESVGKQISMNPLEKIIYDPLNESIQFSKIENTTWEDGKFKFNAMPLKELINLLNKMYCTDIVFDGHDINSTYSGSIRKDESLDEVVNKICFIKNLKQTKEGNRIVLSNQYNQKYKY